MDYLDEGAADGPAIVFLHGIPGSPDWFGAVADRLRARHRVIRVDTREQSGDFSAAARTRPIRALVNELDLRDVTVVGHSFGAELALELAATSDRVARVVVVGQGPDYETARFPSAASWIVRAPVVRAVQRLTPSTIVRLGNRAGFAPGFRFGGAPGAADWIVRDFRTAMPDGLAYAVGNRRADLAANPLDARAAALTVPVLAIHGRHDNLYDATATLSRFAEAGAQTHLVEHAGHSPQVEQPDEFASVLTEFIASGGSSKL
ncbi:hydrolase [Nocardia camponoti]|uniref:Hydrolase n=1 Tax=Nocardia camponoti TaxID=1616106 RepID=A0A917QIK9_9NOCA|nr:hydrolase [Nocardia camponoti]